MTVQLGLLRDWKYLTNIWKQRGQVEYLGLNVKKWKNLSISKDGIFMIYAGSPNVVFDIGIKEQTAVKRENACVMSDFTW